MSAGNAPSAPYRIWICIWIINAALFAFLLVRPPTGWIVKQELPTDLFRNELSPFTGIVLSQSPDDIPAKPPIIPVPTKGDYMFQLGTLLQAGNTNDTDITPQLETLSARFPDKAVFDAAIIESEIDWRNLSAYNSRPDEDLLVGEKPDPDYEKRNQPTVADIRVFDVACIRGEALEQKNAYFPMMRAIGLLVQHRDDEATQSIEKASNDPTWHDFGSECFDAQLKASTDRVMNRGALHDLDVRSGMSVPAGVSRGLAEVATYRAVLDEQHGQTEQGLAIRLALIKIGSRIRMDSSSLYGTLAGAATEQIAAIRPGGLAAEDESRSDQAEQKRERIFLDYLTRIGRPRECALVASEFIQCAAAKKVATELTSRDASLPAAVGTILWFNAGQALIILLLWLAIVGMVLVFQAARGYPIRLRFYIIVPLILLELFIVQHRSVFGIYSLDSLENIFLTPTNWNQYYETLAIAHVCLWAPTILAIVWSILLSLKNNVPTWLARRIPALALVSVIAFGCIVHLTAVEDARASRLIVQAYHGYGSDRMGLTWP